MPNPSLREQLEEAVNNGELETTEEGQQPSQEVQETTEQPAEVTTPAGEQPVKESRERDESGKFQPKPKEQAEKPTPPVKEPVSLAQKQDGTPVPAKGNTDEAPATFSKEGKAAWAQTPPIVRNEMQRMLGVHQTQALQAKQELANTQKDYAATTAVLEPYNKLWMSNGVPPQQGLATAMKAVHDFERDPVGTLKRLAQQYGVKLGEDEQQFVDPLQQKYEDLHKEFTAFKQSQQQSVQATVQQQTNAEVANFTATKDANGNPAYPYFEQVRGQMGQLINSLQFDPSTPAQEKLKRAYEVACYATPGVQEQIQRDNAAREQQKVFDQRQQASRQARNGMISPAPSPATGSNETGQGPRSLREQLEEAYTSGAGRV